MYSEGVYEYSLRDWEVFGSTSLGDCHTKDLKILLTATQCDAHYIKSKENNTSAYAVGLRLTMLEIHWYQYQTVAEMALKRRLTIC